MNPRLNALLEHLPVPEYELFLPHLELISMVRGDVLFDAEQTLDFVYFPVGAVISIICEVDGGHSIEINMVGSTSMVGLTNIGTPSFYKAEVRASGFAYRMSFSTYQQLRQSCPVFMKLHAAAQLGSLRYISLTSACGKHHTIEQQLVRWLLFNLDRTFTPQIIVTHQEVSRLLGFRREAITLTLGKLVHSGSIKLGRGEIMVTDRQLLEQLSCECYWRIQGKSRPTFTSLLKKH
jgi:CRP-like cAMP-binding protein